MVSILGAGGAIGSELLKELAARQEPVRLVSRTPKPVPGAAETLAADLSNLDEAIKAISGSRVAFFVAGLKYDLNVWREFWPRIMHNVIEAAKRSNTKLAFFDNVYMYGRVDGIMTEETPFRPCSKKGEIRAQIATSLLNEIKAGNITALIARAPDFYGPRVKTAVPTVLAFDKLASGSKAAWLVNDRVKHSLTFTPDAARSLLLLAETESAWNQTWHVPTTPNPPTGREFIEMAATELQKQPEYRVLSRPMVWLAGLFDRPIRELHEMLYQYDADYLFDSTKFEKAFGFTPAPYLEGIRACARAYNQPVAN